MAQGNLQGTFRLWWRHEVCQSFFQEVISKTKNNQFMLQHSHMKKATVLS
jgi:hypothetical protein